MGAATAGFFAAGWKCFLYLKMLVYGGAVAAAAGLGFRFKKAVGIPMIMIIVVFIVYTGMVTSPFRCMNNSGDEYETNHDYNSNKLNHVCKNNA